MLISCTRSSKHFWQVWLSITTYPLVELEAVLTEHGAHGVDAAGGVFRTLTPVTAVVVSDVAVGAGAAADNRVTHGHRRRQALTGLGRG